MRKRRDETLYHSCSDSSISVLSLFSDQPILGSLTETIPAQSTLLDFGAQLPSDALHNPIIAGVPPPARSLE